MPATDTAIRIRDELRADYANGRALLDAAIGKHSTPLHVAALRSLIGCCERGHALVDRGGVYVDGCGNPVLEDLVNAGLAIHSADEECEGWGLEEVQLTPDTFYHVSVKCTVLRPSYVMA